jgi:hypothetical protein
MRSAVIRAALAVRTARTAREYQTMLKRHIDRAKAFFRTLGFKQAMSAVIAGEPFASYAG